MPTGSYLYDVYMQTSQKAWTVGAAGTLLQTLDGGTTWQQQASATTFDLHRIFFTNNQTGWITGDSGTLLRTNDGGSTWQHVATGTHNDLISIHFTDAQNGWVVGQNARLHTTDGGATWQDQGATGTLTSVFFLNPQTGWIANDFYRIFKTTNAGNTWQSYNLLSNNFWDVHFLDATNGWAAGYGNMMGLARTTDGGVTWQAQATPVVQSMRSIRFVDAQHAWACGAAGTILKTGDGGNTWQSQTSGTQELLYSIHFVDAQNGMASGNNGVLLKTVNGGATWQILSSGHRNGLNSVQFIDPVTGWAAGDAGTILKTTNGGNTWLSQTTGTNLNITSVSFVDDQNGWAAAGQKILKTTNGGQSWQITPNPSSNQLMAIQFVNQQTGWIIGSNGTIFKTGDGGTTWQNQSSSLLTSFNDLHFMDTQTGWVVGSGNGTVVKTTDGGTTWTTQRNDNTNYLFSVQFLDSQTGWVADANGFFLKTTNGGTTWQTVSFGPSWEFRDFRFINSQVGWVVGRKGVVLKTMDGGVTWARQKTGTTNTISSCSFLDEQTGWVVGEKGTILTTYGNDGLLEGVSQSLVTGSVYQQTAGNCNPNPTAPRLPAMVVKATPGPYYGISDSNGDYKLRLPVDPHSVSNFSLSALPVQSFAFNASAVCPTGNVYAISLDSVPDTLTNRDFQYQVTPCHRLNVEIAANRLRRCALNSVVLNWSNMGSVPAPDAYVLVEFPHWVVPLTSSIAHVVVNDSTWRFDLGTIPPGQASSFSIVDSVVCGNPAIRDLMQCLRATIYPAPDCPANTGWSGASLNAEGRCIGNGLVRLSILNSGSAGMSDSVGYRVYLDSVLVFSRKLKLAQGDSLLLQVEANGKSVWLEVDQVSFHPTESSVLVNINGCGTASQTITKSLVNHFPQAGSAITKSYCLVIQDSYDPNDKQSFPIGFTSNHVVKPGTEMEYLIRFQNTGNDTAFTVYVIDSLDNNLNPESLELGAVSHPYEMLMQTTKQGRTFLRWQFNTINLPDSNTNELKSHGFIQYRISPKSGIALGSQVKNEAAIYFDFNPPVLTNQTLTTFDNLVFTVPGLSGSVHVVVPTETVLSLKQLGVRLYPNPVTQNQLNVSFSSKGSITILNMQGQDVYRKENIEGTSSIPVKLKSGIYMVRISSEKGDFMEKVVVLE